MSRTHRKHESLGKQHKRGPKNRTEDSQATRKPPKQRRPNERVALRKEHL